ncbi:NTP transferase domain-containing protein [Cohnella sp. CFH 77786]|uniref:sugar phosphate nucleotidyltransferase n=1 Tax=Cohnella sp. CFH 77786 TaxID=2662265 RepID=UPI001C610915|nr:NDP-sugar synthase [Cohnella sp. CFH 77786]MBW5447111.1 NTP transferase domain-containing protein [Cohnella sp. CFH 77786]
MKGVILAGGKGTRLLPLTGSLPKPMVPLLGKPCMEYTILLLRRYGICDIAVTTHYRPEALEHYFGDGSRFGVRLRYFAETAPLGTAGGLKNARAFLDEQFVVVSGDALTDVDLSAFVRFHETRNSPLTLMLSRVAEPCAFGIVLTGPEGRIVRFLEKPAPEQAFSDTVNTGIYVMEPEVLDWIPEASAYDFSRQLFPELLEKGIPIYGYTSNAYWSDIGTIRQYVRSQYDMLEGRIRMDIQARQILPGVYVAGGVRLQPGCVVEGPAFIGEGTSIGTQARVGPYAVIGSGNRIERGCRLERAILWDGNRLAAYTDVRDSVLCSGIRAGSGARVPEGTVIGNGAVIGGRPVPLPEAQQIPKTETEGWLYADSDRIETDSILFP